MCSEFTDKPRSLKLDSVRAERFEMLNLPHISPLRDYVKKLRGIYPESEFADFDPLDGGCNADILFLLEKPGPKTSVLDGGSGFISRNNDDPTAEATFNFMNLAQLPRDRTVLWNAIPGWNGTRTITHLELHRGIDHLRELPQLLPKLETIVLVGKKAQRAAPHICNLDYRLLASDHPSPIVRARYPQRWKTIPNIWAEARHG